MSKLFIAIIVVFFTVSSFAQAPKTAKDFSDSGGANYAKGNYDAAIADFTQVIELTSSLVTKRDAPRGNSSAYQSSFDGAIPIERITVLDPRTADGYLNRGNSFFAKGEMDRAISDYNQALLISPASAAVYFCRGTAWLIKKDLERSLADFEKSLKIDPQFVKSYIG